MLTNFWVISHSRLRSWTLKTTKFLSYFENWFFRNFPKNSKQDLTLFPLSNLHVVFAVKTWILFSSGVDSILYLKIWKDFGQFTGFICHGNDTCKTNRVKVAISNILYKKNHLHCKYVQWNYSGSTLKKLYFWKNSVFYCWPFFIVIFKNSKIQKF